MELLRVTLVHGRTDRENVVAQVQSQGTPSPNAWEDAVNSGRKMQGVFSQQARYRGSSPAHSHQDLQSENVELTQAESSTIVKWDRRQGVQRGSELSIQWLSVWEVWGSVAP